MIAPMLRRALLILAVLGVGGCVATKSEPIAYDTAKPAEFARVAGCRDPGRKAGESCLVLVRAADWHTRTTLPVDAGHAWCIEVPQEQVWFDASRASSPLDGEPGSDTMNVLARWKRVGGAPWLAVVVGTVTPAGAEVDRALVRDTPALGACRHGYRPAAAGLLVFYANDAVAPVGSESYFYANNAGQVWVKLTPLP